jgi:hypothetical protein
MSNTANTAAHLTDPNYCADVETSTTKSGRVRVVFTDPVTGDRKRRFFRSARDAGIFVRYLESCGDYWANSATAMMVRRVRAGDVVTINVD